METNNTNVLMQLNLEGYDETYIYKLIDTCFQFFESNIDKEKYEEDVDEFIREFTQYKPAETKFNLKSLIEFIEKYSAAEETYLDENLSLLKMREQEREYFRKCRHHYLEKIETYKLANFGKIMKNKMIDFSHSFYVKYADSSNEKIDFYIKLNFKYLNDEYEEKKLELDLTINQFYALFNDFQKIETMIKTLI